MSDLNNPDPNDPAAGGDEQQPTYVEQLSDDLKKIDWKEHPTINDVFRAYLANKTQLDRAVVIPDEKSSEDEKRAYREKLGVPKDVKEYALSKVNLPPGMQYDQEVESWFKQQAYDLGLTKTQTAQLFDAYAKRMVTGHYNLIEAGNKLFTEAEKVQKEAWGNDYQANVEKAQKPIETFGPEGFVAFLTETKVGSTNLGNHPLMLQFCLNVAKAISEDYVPAGGPAGGGEPRPGEAEGQIHYDKSPDMYDKK